MGVEASVPVPVPDDPLAQAMEKAHRDYGLYPCFFVCDTENGETDGDCTHRVGSLSEFQKLIDKEGEGSLKGKHFTVICLGDNDCAPCDAAKDWLEENKHRINCSILQRRGTGIFEWRDLDTDPLVQKLKGVRKWVYI